MNPSHRLARLARAAEYDQAMQTVERVIRWARAQGLMDLDKEIHARDQVIRTAGSRDAFIDGKWSPPVPFHPRADITPESLLAEVELWEQEEGRAA